MCRIKAGTKKTIIAAHEIPSDSIVFDDATVLLGTSRVNQTIKEIRMVGYRIGHTEYWVATSRFGL